VYTVLGNQTGLYCDGGLKEGEKKNSKREQEIDLLLKK